jgi:predicted transcriptional regulator
MEQEELDSLLAVVENPVRRKIIKRLSQGPAYALQLAKELNLGQPLIAKHMKIMKDTGLVTATTEISPTGPKRKLYSLAKSVTITMDLAPNLFIERAVPLRAKPSKPKTSHEAGQLRRRADDAMAEGDQRERLSQISEVLSDIDSRIEEIEGERMELLTTRNQAMQAAARIANRLEESDKRRVLFHILDEHDSEVDSISEALKLREAAVKTILEELEREFFG